jgi:SAM-dependent methyltransferase
MFRVMHEHSLLIDTQELQKQHYNKIVGKYAMHYGDPTSQAYRERFIHSILFKGIDFSGKRVLEGMCGYGVFAKTLVPLGASVTGVDISEEAIALFRDRWPQCEGLCRSILDTGFESESFDCIIIEAGLHHLHPHIDECVNEIHRILKPGGYFCFCEPHAGSIFDFFRNIWYAADRKMFAANEKSIDLEIVKNKFSSAFDFLEERYFGNIAFFLVFQSMILRIPVAWKKYYAQTLFEVEARIWPLQGKRFSCQVVCQWKKKER